MEHYFMTDRPNPLLFPIIIQKTIKLLDPHSLKRCRLVCKLWEEEVNKIVLIKKYPMTLSKNFDLDLALSISTNSNNIIIPSDIGPAFFTITKDIINRLESPCSNTHIKFLELKNPGWSLSQLKEIISTLPKLEQLTLSEDFVLSKVDHTSSRSLTTPNYPKNGFTNLQSLQLNLRDEDLQNLANIEFLLELYSWIPKLQEVKCWAEPNPNPYTTIFSNILFRSIVESVNLTHCRSVTSLDINLDLRNEDIDLLQRANLPLRTLHIPLDVMISSGRVDELLRSLTGTLKRLKLTHRNCFRCSPLFENMMNLEYLAIHGYDFELRTDLKKYASDQTVLYIFNIVPLTMFPSFLDNFTYQLNKLEEIYLNSVYFISDDIFNFKKLFPNLKRMNVSGLDDEMLRSIFKNFPHLESLIVKDGQFTDSGISGISLDVQEILQNGVTNDLGCGLVEFPNISSLKCLRTLELSSQKVTDFGVVHGVALCRSVQELELNFPQIGNRSLICLTDKLRLDIMSIKSGTFSSPVIEETKLKMEGGAFSLFDFNQFTSYN